MYVLMAYRRGWHSNREEYYQPPDRREAIPHRVVNIIPRRGSGSESSYNFSDESWLNENDGSWIKFDDSQWSKEDKSFGSSDHRHSSSSHRKSSPTRSEAAHHPQHSYSRDDLRHQLNSRKNSRPHPYHSRDSEPLTGSTKTHRTCVGDSLKPLQPVSKFRIAYTRDELLDLRDSPSGKTPYIPEDLLKGLSACRAKAKRQKPAKRGSPPDYRSAPSVGIKREHSPVDICSRSKNRKTAPEDKGPAIKQEEPSERRSVTVQPLSSVVKEEPQQEPLCPQGAAVMCHQLPMSEVRDSGFTVKKEKQGEEPKSPSDIGFLTRRSDAIKAKAVEIEKVRDSGFTVKKEKQGEEPKSPSDKGFLTRRSDAIKAKAVEIEKNYRQDCETFRTVVKMLVSKKPSLDGLLQASLDENLQELKQRCLDALRSFVSELDEILQPPDDST